VEKLYKRRPSRPARLPVEAFAGVWNRLLGTAQK